HVSPGSTRHLQRIYRIGNDVQPQPQIIGGDAIGNHVALRAIYRDSRSAQSLLNRVNAQVNGAALLGELLREGRFTRPWKAAKYVEHSPLPEAPYRRGARPPFWQAASCSHRAGLRRTFTRMSGSNP